MSFARNPGATRAPTLRAVLVAVAVCLVLCAAGAHAAQQSKNRGRQQRFGRRAPPPPPPKPKMPDHYAVLGLPKDAHPIEIKRAYHKLARELHPDKNNHLPKELMETTRAKFRKVQGAYDVLSDPTRRKRYDSGLDPHDTGPTGPRPGGPFGMPAQFTRIFSAGGAGGQQFFSFGHGQQPTRRVRR